MSTAHSKHRTYRRGRSGLLAALVLPAVLTGCSINDILSVELPGVVDSEALNNPVLARVLVDGVIADFECAWANYSTALSQHSDEWLAADVAGPYNNWSRRLIDEGDGPMGSGFCSLIWAIYTPLHAARFQGEDVYDRLEGFDLADVPDKAELQGIARAYGAYSLVALGEGFCSMAIDGGPELTPADVFAIAETKFSDAITLAQGAGNTATQNMALVGRARIRIDLQDWAGAITDASQVTPGFLINVDRGSEVNDRENRNFRWLSDPNNGQGRRATIASHFRDLRIMADGTPTAYCDALGASPAAGCDGPEGAALLPGEVADPRVVVTTIGLFGNDQVSPHYTHDRYSSNTDPMPIASYEEARLYIAEAEAQLGNLDNAIGEINNLRAPLGIPQYATPTTLTQAAVITAVLEERRRVLFQWAGHRVNDMIRYQGTPYEIPWLGDPGSIHPSGIDQVGNAYGTTTCLPLPLVETEGNPNIG